jgi:hypothetical protein
MQTPHLSKLANGADSSHLPNAPASGLPGPSELRSVFLALARALARQAAREDDASETIATGLEFPKEPDDGLK